MAKHNALGDLSQTSFSSTEDYCKPEAGCQSAFGTCSSGSGSYPPKSSADKPKASPAQDTADTTPDTSASSSRQAVEEKSGCSKAPGTSVSFAHHLSYNFSSVDALPDGLKVSDYPSGGDSDAPATHTFLKENVAVKDGYLELRVPGGQRSTIKSAEVQTAVEDMVQASVRMTAILSAVEGTCQSSFFYKSDTQETDIEFLSSPSSTSNPSGKPSLHFTNQQTTGYQSGGSPTTKNTPVPRGAFDTPVEYRIDWLADRTVFYVDGEKTAEFDKNVPSEPGPWLWNNWSNGGEDWTAGPPAEDSVMRIQGIEMWYDRAGDGDKCGGA
ncbi:MAG: hypothetical protein M1831_005513 [Alyxoria varia]|nr:MAG: hypothetical protein M1831_005513 [Alyxoria varia]